MQVYVGRPKNEEGRLPKEIRVYDFLDNLGVEYYRVDHGEAGTMDECAKIEKELDTVICKNLFLCNRQKTRFYLLMMPRDKVYKTKDFSPLVGSSRLSFAGEEDMLKYLDVTPGSVSIMGLINDKDKVVHLAIDEDVLKPDFVGCHPCINTSSLKIKKTDILEKYLPAVGHTPQIVTLPKYESEE
ncbi:MAG: prolyl-tRNA synthetase associated domain-containing protein [Ruminococcaceae bacterium]|nr:prolyl-tRNA synthetase associated domain-containing protein [Oscillospiraceae bacterium]